MQLSYTNRKGKEVIVDVHPHALERFKERYYRLTNCKRNPNEMFSKLFQNAKIVDTEKDGNKKYKKRKKKHNSPALYLRNSEVTFIVENATVKTVEISAKGLRNLN